MERFATTLTACPLSTPDKPYRETLLLPDGRAVLLRPAHHRDAPALAAFFAGLSPRARLLRFHGAVNRLPDSALRTLTTQVPAHHVALVATTRTADGLQPLLAEARYVVDDEGAEFAVTVADGWQGLGLGRALVQRLRAHASVTGMGPLHGSIVPGNEAMLGLMASLGATLVHRGAEVVATLEA